MFPQALSSSPFLPPSLVSPFLASPFLSLHLLPFLFLFISLLRGICHLKCCCPRINAMDRLHQVDLCVCWWQDSRYEYVRGFVPERVHEQLSECKCPYMDALLFGFSFCLLFFSVIHPTGKDPLSKLFQLLCGY